MMTRSGLAASTSRNRLKSRAGSEQEVNATRDTGLPRGKGGPSGALGKSDRVGTMLGLRAQPAIGIFAKAKVVAEVRKFRRCNMGMC